MDSSVSPKDEIWFLRLCHHFSNAVYCHTIDWTLWKVCNRARISTTLKQNPLLCAFLRHFRHHLPPNGSVRHKRLFHYRREQAIRVPGVWRSQTEFLAGSQMTVTMLSTRRPGSLDPWYSFPLEAESTSRIIVRPEGLYQWKIRVTPSEIKAANCRITQCHNQLGDRVPRM